MLKTIAKRWQAPFCGMLFFMPILTMAQPVKRTILAFYDSIEEPEEDKRFRVTKYAATILNHLGMKMKYHDLKDGTLPSDEDMKDVHGLLIWFRDDSMPKAEQYLSWVESQIHKGVKVVIFEDMGAEANIEKRADSKDSEPVLRELPEYDIERVYKALGLDYRGNYEKRTHLLELTTIDPLMMNFEKDIRYDLKTYSQVHALQKTSKVYLKGDLRGREGSESDLVVITPYGGYASFNTVLFFENTQDHKLYGWYLNPFKFFSEAYDIGQRPIPDITTTLGNRNFYIQIDGDGFDNLSHINQKILSPQFIYDEILTKYKIPHAASVIVGEIDPKLLGSEKSVALAKKIFELPYVEMGSHGYGHPLHWKEKDVGVFQMKEKFGYKVSNYDKEIRYSTEWINQNLAPPQKKVTLFQWTGECDPPEEAMKIPYDMGLKNLNGGDSEWDTSFPSILGIAALTRQEGNWIQYLASNANENIYTNLWKGPFYGFRKVIETFERTESPRRIRPINIYYHYYSGERLASLQALKTVYDYALQQPIFPLYPTEYVSIVEGFHSMKLIQKDNGWEIKSPGFLRTVRFDESSAYPDFNRSKGIMGFMHFQKSLYIYLKEDAPYLIFLTATSPKIPYLSISNVHISDWTLKAHELKFKALGYIPALIKIQNLRQNQSYTVMIGTQSQTLRSSPRGELTIQYNSRKEEKVTINL